MSPQRQRGLQPATAVEPQERVTFLTVNYWSATWTAGVPCQTTYRLHETRRLVFARRKSPTCNYMKKREQNPVSSPGVSEVCNYSKPRVHKPKGQGSGRATTDKEGKWTPGGRACRHTVAPSGSVCLRGGVDYVTELAWLMGPHSEPAGRGRFV